METEPPATETTWVVDERRHIDWGAMSCFISCASLCLLCASVAFPPLAHALGFKSYGIPLIGGGCLFLAAAALGFVGLYMGIVALRRECVPKRFAIGGIVFSLPASLFLAFIIFRILVSP